MKCTKQLSCRQFLREFHYSRLWFTFSDWRSLVYIPWLPYKWPFQVIHVIYRWVMAFYFLSWLIASGVLFQFGPYWLIFLTNWAIVCFVAYLFISAFSVSAKFLTVHACKRVDSKSISNRTTDYLFEKPEGCCGYGSNKLSWYQMIHWASFSVFAEMALVVTILYWALIYTGGRVDGINANVHLVNGIVSILDVLVFGVPISFLHFIYPMAFISVYVAFSGIFYAASGAVIYLQLDYGGNPVGASITVVLVVLLFVPAVHLVYYALYLARFWVVYAIYGRSKVSCWGEIADEEYKEEAVEMENV